MIQIKVKNDIKLSNLERLIDKNIDQALNLIGIKVANDAKNEHEYQSRTGNLRQSTQYWIDKATNQVKIFIDDAQADYGKYVHGDDRFIYNAMVKNEQWIKSMLDKAVSDAVDTFNRR